MSEQHVIINVPRGSAMGVDHWWDAAAIFYHRALQHSGGEQSPEDVYRSLVEGESIMLLGLVEPGPVVASAFQVDVIEYPRTRALRVVLAAGEPMSAWIDPLIAKLEAGCHNVGATSIELFGRPGFTRALKGRAFEQYTVMVRQVTDGQGQEDQEQQRADAAA